MRNDGWYFNFLRYDKGTLVLGKPKAELNLFAYNDAMDTTYYYIFYLGIRTIFGFCLL